MSLSADALKFLVGKGFDTDDLIAFAQCMERAYPVERSAAAVRQARYRERGGGKIPDDLRTAVFERDGYRCLDCGTVEQLCCDHIIPVSKGGETTEENLQTLCRPCNSRKKDRIRKRDKARKSSGNSGGNSHGKSVEHPPNEYISNPPSSVSNETGGEAADPVKSIFDLGVSILMASGTPEKQARSLLGKWRKAKSDAEVLAALLDCRARSISNPVEWIEARFKSAQFVSKSGYEYRGDLKTILKECERRGDNDTYWAVKSAMKAA